MMGHREKMKSGDEIDALTKRARQSLKVFRKAGLAHKAKKSFSRRLRHEARTYLDNESRQD